MKLKHHFLFGAVLLAFGATAQAQSVDLTPASTTVTPGSSFAVEVSGNGFSDATVGGGFNLLFNAAVLRLDSIVFSPSWEFSTSPGTIDNSAGSATGVFFNSFTPKAGSFAIGTLNFTGIGAGTSALTLAGSGVFPFSDTLGNVVAPSFGAASVTAVPEPGSVALMAAGLIGLVLVRRRQQA